MFSACYSASGNCWRECTVLSRFRKFRNVSLLIALNQLENNQVFLCISNHSPPSNSTYYFALWAGSGILSAIPAIQEVHVKQSLGAKTLLFPTPVLMVGTYDQVNGYHGVGPLLGMAFTVGKKIG